MDIDRISTDLLNLAFLGHGEDISEDTNDELKEDTKQPVETEMEAAATGKQRKNLSTIDDDDLAEEARRGIFEKYKSKSSQHLLADSHIASSSPRNTENSRRQDAGKLMYSSEAQVTMSKTKKKSWFAKRKSKSKNKNKGLKKLSDDTKVTIKVMGKLNGKRPKAKAVVQAEHAEIPSVIKLKKVTRPISDIRNTKERGGLGSDRDRTASFTDSVSTLSHHVHEDGNTWIEQGLSSLVNSVFSKVDDDGPTVKDAKGQTWTVHIDDYTGLPYYHNPVTRSTTWTNPAEGIEKVEAIDNQETTVSTPTMNPIIEGRPASPFDMKEMKPLLHNDKQKYSTFAESNTDAGTKLSDSDGKRSKGSTETDNDPGTYDDTHGTTSTGHDGTWIEQGVMRMLDNALTIGLGDVDVDDDTLFDSLVSEQASKESKAGGKTESVDSKLARKPHLLRQSYPSTVPEKPPTVTQRNDPLVGTEAEGDKKNSSDVLSAAGASWFGNLVAMMSHDDDEEEVDTKTEAKRPTPQNSEPWYSIQLVSSIDGPESVMSAASRGRERDACKSTSVDQSSLDYTRSRSFSDPGLPHHDSRKRENRNKDKEPASGPSFLHTLYNTVMSEDEAEDAKETPPLNRTLTGLTGITGASVFSGISDGGPLREQLAAKQECLLNDDQCNEESFDSESPPAKPCEDKVTTSSRNPNEVSAEMKVTADKKSERSPWKPIFDPQTGRTYYFHSVTRQRTWTKPDDFDCSKNPTFYWGIARKDSINVGPPSPSKESTIVTEEAQNAILNSSEMEVSKLSSSLEISSDEDFDMVDIIDNHSYDPTAAVHVSPSFRSMPNTEVEGRKGQSHSKEPCKKTPFLEGKKSKRNPFSWRRKLGFEKDSEKMQPDADVPVSANGGYREQDKLAARLLAEVERRIDPMAAEDYSYVSGYEEENAVDRSTDKKPTGLSPHIVMDESRSTRAERVGRKLMKGTSDSNDSHHDAEASNTEPKRRKFLQRFKPKFRKNISTGKSHDTKFSGSETATKESSSTEKKVPVYAEIDTERDYDETAKETKSAGMRAKRPSKAIHNVGMEKCVRKRSMPRATKSPAVPPQEMSKKPPAVSQKKKDITNKKESPASVLHFEKVGEEDPTEDAETRTRRRIWQAKVDPASGRTFYYNRITRQTTWTEPGDMYESFELADNRECRCDEESLSCKLDKKFAIVDGNEDVAVFVKSVRPKHTEAEKFKREPTLTKPSMNLKGTLARAQPGSASQPPIYSKPARQWPETVQQPSFVCVSADELRTSIIAEAELLGQVVDSPLQASLRMRDELEKVTTQLFHQAVTAGTEELSQLENKSESSTVALPNPYLTGEIDIDELSRPEDEVTGTLATPKKDSVLDDSGFNSKEESTVADSTFSSSLDTSFVDKKLQETLWDDLLFM
jgi:hypothetical protein